MEFARKTADRDCYAQLGVRRFAPEADVRRAFREQAKVWHPDKCTAPNAAERFRLLREAFETLTTPAARREHDCALTAAERSRGLRAFQSEPRPGAPAGVSASMQAQFSASASSTSAGARPMRLADLLQTVEGNSRVPLAEVRRQCVALGISWPSTCSERTEALAAVARSARSMLDGRIFAGEWGRLAKEDLVYWLQNKGCALKYALECDSVDMGMLIRLAKGFSAQAQQKKPSVPLKRAQAPPQQQPQRQQPQQQQQQQQPPQQPPPQQPQQQSVPTARPQWEAPMQDASSHVDAPASAPDSLRGGRRSMFPFAKARAAAQEAAASAFAATVGDTSKNSLAASSARTKGVRRRRPAGSSRGGRRSAKRGGGLRDDSFDGLERDASPQRPAAVKRRRLRRSGDHAADLPATASKAGHGEEAKASGGKQKEAATTARACAKASGVLRSARPQRRQLSRQGRQKRSAAQRQVGTAASTQASSKSSSSSSDSSWSSSSSEADASSESSSSSSEAVHKADDADASRTGNVGFVNSAATVSDAGATAAAGETVAARPVRSAAALEVEEEPNLRRSQRQQASREEKVLRARLEELRQKLAEHRIRGNGTDQARIAPTFRELESLDNSGKIDRRMLLASRLGMELNNVWWRRSAHGAMAQRAAVLVLRWMKRTMTSDASAASAGA
eukprot:TRINITY_DN17020_c0_g1_i1.p1 TRINITY_DN17020_c0_g1~~TRINITY_DN17020_c0_g1_i1.p1  ORF type:complete len:678 (+),score=134.91 TRINITY_DN17020_c0_g1_i1:129-2162(+)